MKYLIMIVVAMLIGCSDMILEPRPEMHNIPEVTEETWEDIKDSVSGTWCTTSRTPICVTYGYGSFSASQIIDGVARLIVENEPYEIRKDSIFGGDGVYQCKFMLQGGNGEVQVLTKIYNDNVSINYYKWP